jgi:hypothetical protein
MRTILQHPVYANKAKEFIGFWLVRHGADSVELEELDEYFSYVAQQLTKMGKLKVIQTRNGNCFYSLIKDK